MILRKCFKCNKYTLSGVCCNEKTKNPHPMKFSISDKFGKYRRAAKLSKNNDR